MSTASNFAVTFRALDEEGRRAGAWSTQRQLGRLIGRARSTVQDYVHGRATPSDGNEVLEIMRAHVQAADDRTHGYSRDHAAPLTINEPSLVSVRTPELAQPAPAAQERSTMSAHPSAHVPDGLVVDAFWFESLKTGILAIPNPVEEKTHFLLPASCFRTLRGGFTPSERTDTKTLIRSVSIGLDELNRRLMITAQLEDATERQQMLTTLAKNIDEFVRLVRVVRDTVPTEAALHMEEEDKLLGVLSQSTRKG